MVDLWITPPAYTRRAPLVSEQTRGRGQLAVPTGSERRLQAHHLADGAAAADARLSATRTCRSKSLGPGSGEAQRRRSTATPCSRSRTPPAGEIATLADRRRARTPCRRSSFVRRAARAPTVASCGSISRPRTITASPSWRCCWRRPGREAEIERLTLLKPGNQPPKLATGTYQDLTAHPLAGLPVVLRLEAVDAIGQRGQSAPAPDRAAGARVPQSAGAGDHRGAAQAGRRRRRPAGEVAQRLAALGDTPAAQQLPAAVPLGCALAAARLAMNEGDAGKPALGGRPALGAGAVHRGRLAVAGRAQAARPAAAAAEGDGGGCQGRRARAADGGAAAGDGRVPAGADPPGAGAGPADAAASRCRRPETEPDGRSPGPAGDARPGARADAQRCPRRGARHAGAAAGDAGEPARRHAAGAAVAGRAEPERPAEDDPAAAAAARAQLPDGPRAAQGEQEQGRQQGSRASATGRAGPAGPGRQQGQGVSRARTSWASPRPSRRRCAGRWAS